MKYAVLIFIFYSVLFLQAANAQSVVPTSVNVKTIAQLSIEKNDERIKNDFMQKYYRSNLSPEKLSELLKASEIKQLSAATLDDFLHDVADEFRGFIQSHSPDLASIFRSKLDKFIYQFVLKNLNYKYKKLDDITATIDNKNQVLNIYRLTTEPTKNSNTEQSKKFTRYFGFYIELISQINLKTVKNKKRFQFDWQSSSSQLHAEIKISPKKDLHKIITTANPDYKKLASDGIYKGIVLFGSNMQNLTLPTVGNYMLHLKNLGFETIRYDRNVNTSEYLQTNMYGLVNNETMDYLVKEAHSDGDEKNVFRISQKSRIMRFEKMNTSGYKDVVELAYPEEGPQPTQLVSNNEFARWMELREQNINQQLIYLNGSCWSNTKAQFEIAAVGSVLFINIPTKTVSLTFDSRSQNGTFQVFDGLQKMKSYAEIRTNLAKVESYNNRTKDYYIFPDEAVYAAEFGRFGLNTFDFEIKITKKIGSDFLDYAIDSDDPGLFN